MRRVAAMYTLMHPQSCEESELDARHPHARRAHDASVQCRWPGVLILWRVYQERATSGSDVLSERGSLSLPSLPPPASVLPPLTVEQRRCEHCRRMLHPAALSKRCGTAHTHLQPTPPPPVQTTSHTTLCTPCQLLRRVRRRALRSTRLCWCDARHTRGPWPALA
jgi:hypothetical protein